MAIAGKDDTIGLVTVDGTGSTLNAGNLLRIGADFADGEVAPEDGGYAFLEVINGGSLTAGQIVVGEAGIVDLTGSVTGDLIVHGIMDVGDDVVATLDLTGDFIVPRLGVLSVDIDDFAGGTGDKLNISGSALLDTRSNIFFLEIEPTAAITAGDTYVLASAVGGMLAESRTVYDLTRGIEFTLSTDGTDLILTAEETVAASAAPPVESGTSQDAVEWPGDREIGGLRWAGESGTSGGDIDFPVPSLTQVESGGGAPDDVSGTGGYLIDNDTISVGIGTVGNATIDGNGPGFNESVTVFDVGHAGGDGTLTLIGGGAGVNITVEDPLTSPFSASVRVGIDGDGTLNITNGAQVISMNSGYYDPNFYAPGVGQLLGGYYNVNVGVRGTGMLNVNGSGSFLGTYGDSSRITIGRDNGTGTLNVENGGDVGTMSLVIGRQNSTGYVNVDGAGSTLTVNDVHGQYGLSRGFDSSGYAGGITVGREGSDGTLMITGGGLVSISNTDTVTDNPYMSIGREPDATGSVTVSGVGSRLEIVQSGAIGDDASGGAFLGIGRSGQGAMTVTAGGVVDVIGEDAFVAIASARAASGPGITAESHLAITAGGIVNVSGGVDDGGWLSVGRTEFGRGRLDVDGAGSQLNLTGNVTNGVETGGFLDVGYDGIGGAYITNGGSVTIDGNDGLFPGFIVGRGQGDGSTASKGYLLVDGVGSSITVLGDNTSTLGGNGFISVGRNANTEGVMVISNGGVVSNTGSVSAMEIAGNYGARGSVTVEGIGSALNSGSLLSVGSDFVGGVNLPDVGGLGFLEVIDGASLTAGAIFIGENGTVDLTGSVTGDLTNHGIMEVGDDVVATLNLTGDFTLASLGVLSIDITDFAGGTGDKLNITGAAVLETRSNVFVLEVATSAAITTGDTYVLATATGGMTAETRTVYDSTRGIEFTLSASGNNLILTAEESAAACGPLVAGDENANSLTGSALCEEIDGLGGDDTLAGLAGDDSVYGGIGNDSIRGGDGDDLISGGSGNDLVNGQGDHDTILGDDGSDILFGSAGNDAVIGGNDADSLFGGTGNDTIMGGADDDVLDGGAGADSLNGGTGNDTASYASSGAAVNVDLATGAGSGGDAAGDILVGIEHLVGSDFNDILFRRTLGVNSLFGGDGIDVLQGGAGADVSGRRCVAGLGGLFRRDGSADRSICRPLPTVRPILPRTR